MSRRNDVIVAIDIGTSKIAVAVAQSYSNGEVQIKACIETKTTGIRRGQISDYHNALSALNDAIQKAEQKSGTTIRSVYVSINGPHIKGTNHEMVTRLPEGKHVVTRSFLIEACDMAKDINVSIDETIVSDINKGYSIDGQEYTTTVEGLSAKELRVSYHIIHGKLTLVEDLHRLIRHAHLDIAKAIFSPIATAECILKSAQRDRGALMIDMGAGTTSYALYLKGKIIASGCIGLGGENISNDIYIICQIPLSVSEQLKIKEGDASPSPASSIGYVRPQSNDEFIYKEIERSTLNGIIRSRLEEIFSQILKALPAREFAEIQNGIHLTGRASNMRGIEELAHQFFGKAIYKLTPNYEEENNSTNINDPGFTTVQGLIRSAQIDQIMNPKPRGWLRSLFS